VATSPTTTTPTTTTTTKRSRSPNDSNVAPDAPQGNVANLLPDSFTTTKKD
jgi:hypothetical protein